MGTDLPRSLLLLDLSHRFLQRKVKCFHDVKPDIRRSSNTMPGYFGMPQFLTITTWSLKLNGTELKKVEGQEEPAHTWKKNLYLESGAAEHECMQISETNILSVAQHEVEIERKRKRPKWTQYWLRFVKLQYRKIKVHENITREESLDTCAFKQTSIHGPLWREFLAWWKCPRPAYEDGTRIQTLVHGVVRPT